MHFTKKRKKTFSFGMKIVDSEDSPSAKIRLQVKIHNFPIKNGNIIIKEII